MKHEVLENVAEFIIDDDDPVSFFNFLTNIQCSNNYSVNFRSKDVRTILLNSLNQHSY